MTTPEADKTVMDIATGAWERCQHFDEATGLRCDFITDDGDYSHHAHSVYHPRDLDVPPWHRRIVSFAEAARIATPEATTPGATE